MLLVGCNNMKQILHLYLMRNNPPENAFVCDLEIEASVFLLAPFQKWK